MFKTPLLILLLPALALPFNAPAQMDKIDGVTVLPAEAVGPVGAPAALPAATPHSAARGLYLDRFPG